MKSLVIVLTVLATCLVTAGSALAVEVGPYDVSLVTMRYDYPSAGHSTWFYTATSSPTSGAISHLVLELGACCSVTDAGLWTMLPDGSFVLDSWWNSGKIEVVQDPTTGVFGIKFDDVFDEGETRNYYFTVEGNHAVAYEAIKVAIKTGGPTALLSNGAGLLASVSGFLTRLLDLAGKDFTTYEALISGPALDCEQTTAVTLTSFSAVAPSGLLSSGLLIPGAALAAAACVPAALTLAGRRLRREEE